MNDEEARCKECNHPKYAHVVNAADYGAVGDGSTDDTTAIQSALTAASCRRWDRDLHSEVDEDTPGKCNCWGWEE